MADADNNNDSPSYSRGYNRTALWSGKRTGIRVVLPLEFNDLGIEDPTRVFAAIRPPRRQLDLSGGPLSPPGLSLLNDDIEVESVKTAPPDTTTSPPRVARDAPEETRTSIQQNDNMDEEEPIVENDEFPEENVEEDDLLPPPPPALDDDDDDGISDSGDEISNLNDEKIDEVASEDEDAAEEDVARDDTTSEAEAVVEQVDFPVDDDDHDDGEGFAMTESASPPNKRKRSHQTKDNSSKKKVRIRTPQDDAEETSTEEESVKKPVKKTKKRATKRLPTKITPKGRPQARSYKEIPLSELRSDSDDENPNLRRSKRVHIPPLEWWKGETYILGRNNFGDEFDGVTNMPVVKGIKKPLPTPYKKAREPARKKSPKRSKKGRQVKKEEEDDDDDVFDSFEVEKMYDINEGDSANLLHEYGDEITRRKIVSRFKSQVHQHLPLPKGARTKREGKKTGKATQCFNLISDIPGAPSFISGTLILPPKAIKDAESVLSNVQHFTVIDCQPNAFEVAYADPREDDNKVMDETAEHFLLEKGDTFFVPSGNAYRLVNHSRTKEALVSWMIVRNTAEEEEEETYDD